MHAFALAGLLLASPSGASLLSAAPQDSIPMRQVAVPVATAYLTGAIRGLKQLPSGAVLVNVPSRRQLVLLDSNLVRVRVVLDSVIGESTSYPRQGLPLIRYAGDSVLFVDLDATSFLVLDPDGNVARVMAPPSVSDIAQYATTSFLGGMNAGLDGQGRLVYRGHATPEVGNDAIARRWVDSLPLLRVDLETRRADTIARVAVQARLRVPTPVMRPDGKWVAEWVLSPMLPMVDDWAVLSDGSVAIVRGATYHVDWIRPDGARSSSPRMPFPWHRLSTDEKQAKIDSARNVIDSLLRAGDLRYHVARAGSTGREVVAPEITFVAPEEMNDYVAPMRPYSVKADEDGHLWILPTIAARRSSGLLYDIVNANGELIERVALPSGRDIVGFGRGGVLYLASAYHDGIRLEKARVH